MTIELTSKYVVRCFYQKLTTPQIHTVLNILCMYCNHEITMNDATSFLHRILPSDMKSLYDAYLSNESDMSDIEYD